MSVSAARKHSKLRFSLAGDEPARAAVSRVVERMLEIARGNEPGIIADTDPEFLHEYRIRLRTVRSVLTQLRGVYPAEPIRAEAAEMAAFARATGRLRDLDVHLLAHDEYEDLLPETLRDGLREMFADFERMRVEEHQRVCAHLQSTAYRRRMETSRALFALPDALPESKHSREPIREVVSHRIYRRYRRIAKLARSIDMDSPNQALHDLRIQGKKLRYLLELFGELYEPADMARLLKRLRRLQNRLGRFNDCTVQQASLRAYWVDPGLSHSPELALSLGGLLGALYREQLHQRKRSLNALSSVRDGTAKSLFKHTFRS